MKRYIIILFVTALVVGCSTSDIEPTLLEGGEGRVSLAMSAESSVTIISSSAQRSTDSTVEIPAEFIPSVEEFSLIITGRYYDTEEGEYMDFYEEYESLAAYNTSEVDEDDPSVSCPPYLTAGEYTAVMECGEGVDVESATNAHFKGTLDFTVLARDNAQATLTATLQNSIIALNMSDNFKSYFAQGATLTLSTTQQTSMTIDMEDPTSEEQILFVSPGTTLYLEGEGVKQDPGDGSAPVVTFAKSAIGVTTAMTKSTVVVDADDAGGQSIAVTMDDSYTEINATNVDLH